MNHQLSEAFHELAEQATTARISGPPPSHELWQRGRQARRRRLAASVLAVGVALVFVGALAPMVGDSSRTTPPPATFDESRLAVPDHIWAPSSWARTADEAHPPGPLALIASAPRQKPWLTTTTQEWYGVSAADQTYWWLELPGRATQEPGAVALSPDGRRVGYLLGGRPAAENPQSDIVGFAVYDTVTGQTRRHPVPTQRGLSPDELTWTPDSRHLVVSHGQWASQEGVSTRASTVSWDIRTDQVTVLHGLRTWDQLGTGLGGITGWADDDSNTVLVVDPGNGATRRLRVSGEGDPALTRGNAMEVNFNPSGSAAVMEGDLPVGAGSFTTGLHAARVNGQRLVAPRLLGVKWQLNRILGWVDDERVLTDAHPRNGDGLRYVTYDVRTGSVDPAISHTDPPGSWLRASFAQDLLRRPFVVGKVPPRPWHPWWGWAVVLLAGLVLALARRSVRRREEERLLRGSDT